MHSCRSCARPAASQLYTNSSGQLDYSFPRIIVKTGGTRMVVNEKSKALVEKVKQIISEQLGVEEAEITPSSSFVDDLGADSLDTVELVMALEENFDLEIPDEAAEKIRTVQDAVDYIEKHSKVSK